MRTVISGDHTVVDATQNAINLGPPLPAGNDIDWGSIVEGSAFRSEPLHRLRGRTKSLNRVFPNRLGTPVHDSSGFSEPLTFARKECPFDPTEEILESLRKVSDVHWPSGARSRHVLY